MEKITVVFVDGDENYLMALEKKFVEELGGYINISIITDMSYFREYFSTPKDIDVLVMNEQLYGDDMRIHNVQHTYLLSENPVYQEDNSIYKKVYKYTSVVDVFSAIVANDVLRVFINKAKSAIDGVVTVYSPSGGTGKTTIAIGLAVALVKAGNKVIYVSTENFQDHGYYMDNSECIPKDYKNQLMTDKNIVKDTIGQYVRNSIVDYILPFDVSLDSLEITKSNYITIIDALKELNVYDYIIVDTDSTFDKGTVNLLDYSDRVMIVTSQEKTHVSKLKKFVNINKNDDKDKYIYICNKYNECRENDLINNINLFYVKEYIYYDSTLIDCKTRDMLGNYEIDKLLNAL